MDGKSGKVEEKENEFTTGATASDGDDGRPGTTRSAKWTAQTHSD